MNHPLVKNTFLFVLLLLLQVLIFNNIAYWGYVNPMVYIVFLLVAPYRENKTPYLLISFFLGLCVDIFSNTGVLHAASAVFIAYLRSPILHIVFGKNFEYQELDLLAYPFTKVLSYTTLMVVLHHILFYFLEVFNFNHLLLTIAKIIGASVFTVIVSLLFIYLFSRNKK